MPVFAMDGSTSNHRVVYPDIKIGDKFDSFCQLEKFLSDLQTHSKVQLYRRDCKSLQSAQKRYPGRVGKAKLELKYYFVEYCCVFGGRRHKSKSTGDRTNTR